MKKASIIFIFAIFAIFTQNIWGFCAEENQDTPAQPENSAYTQTTPPYFAPYMRELQRKIKLNWDPPKRDSSKSVTLFFKIAKDGSLVSYRIEKSSGDQEIDDAAIKALKSAEPFRPLPSEYKGNTIDIKFNFDYNVISSTNSSNKTLRREDPVNDPPVPQSKINTNNAPEQQEQNIEESGNNNNPRNYNFYIICGIILLAVLSLRPNRYNPRTTEIIYQNPPENISYENNTNSTPTLPKEDDSATQNTERNVDL